MTDGYDHLSVQKAGEVHVLTITLQRVASYELAEAMGRELAGAIHGSLSPKVVVDLRNVEYMSSVGYGPFISLRVRVRDAEGRLILCGLSPLLKELFEATRLLINPRSPTALFEFADTLDIAVALARS